MSAKARADREAEAFATRLLGPKPRRPIGDKEMAAILGCSEADVLKVALERMGVPPEQAAMMAKLNRALTLQAAKVKAAEPVGAEGAAT